MFGYIIANDESLDEAEKARWHSAYCGLCRTLGKRCGQHCRLTLTFDMTFLSLLLQSLYEPMEQKGEARCVLHPTKPQAYETSEAMEYAADVGILLAYHKCMDDWNDERKLAGRAAAASLAGAYRKAKSRLPRQAEAIEQGMADILDLERKAQAGEAAPEAPANRFGALLGEAFVWRDDIWAADMRRLGAWLGKFIFMMDAVVDFDEDAKTGAFNPVAAMGANPADMGDALTLLIANATQAFERLPLEQDLHLLRSVLYAGVWQKYRAHFEGAHDSKANEQAKPQVNGQLTPQLDEREETTGASREYAKNKE